MERRVGSIEEAQRRRAPLDAYRPSPARFRGPTASIFIPVGGEMVIEQCQGRSMDRSSFPPSNAISFTIAATHNQAFLRRVEKRGRNRSKRNAIGTTFRASIPTKNRTRNWSASYNTDRCPVAVGRGRELESPFTIIYFKIALYILTRYFVLARTTLSPKRFPLPHYRSLGMVAVIVFLSLELSSKIVLRIILFWRTKFRSNVYFRTRKKNNSCQLFRISFRRKEKNCSFIKLIPVYISE